MRELLGGVFGACTPARGLRCFSQHALGHLEALGLDRRKPRSGVNISSSLTRRCRSPGPFHRSQTGVRVASDTGPAVEEEELKYIL